ncbi:hypothetical protein GQ53DRAFT_742081 [Thozetella sp. PMI_491]|nr:hypothetical protein GQ53DRAFT_742081 [Thozetella sp. PMI_491]
MRGVPLSAALFRTYTRLRQYLICIRKRGSIPRDDLGRALESNLGGLASENKRRGGRSTPFPYTLLTRDKLGLDTEDVRI